MNPDTRPADPDEAFATSERSDAPVRLAYIDGLRACCALYVLVCHAFFEPSDGYYPARWLNHLGLAYGHIAVDVFIVISGFCLMLPVARRGNEIGSIRAFFRRRARRILPPYYAALGLSALFILTVAHEPTPTIWQHALPLTWPDLLAHLLLIHNIPSPWWQASRINVPLWSIAVECQVYLFFPAIVVSLRRAGNAITLLWTVGAGLLLCLLPHVSREQMLSFAPWYLGLFTMGMVAARVCRENPGGLEAFGRAGGAVWLLSGLILILRGKSFFIAYMPLFDTFFGAGTALLLAALYADATDRKWTLTRLLSHAPLAAVGLFSYSIYLIHLPLLHAVWLAFPTSLHPHTERLFFILLACCPAIVAAAYLFFLVFERPFLSRSVRRI